jgi:hypothetical protein
VSPLEHTPPTTTPTTTPTTRPRTDRDEQSVGGSTAAAHGTGTGDQAGSRALVSVDELLADLDAHAVLADLHADTTTSAATGTAGGATGSPGGGDGDGEAGRSQASRLVALAQEAYDLVLGTDGRAY